MSLDFEKLRETRAANPEAIADAYKNRKRRDIIQDDGRLFIVAADHTARGALGVRDDETAMADRYELLNRLAIALKNPGVDGVLATPDILDDLALLGLLDGKLAVASMNRVGLKGAKFEMDDRFASHNFEAIKREGLDMAKTLTRINFEDENTAKTLEYTANAINDAVAAKTPILVEPFISKWVNGKIVNDLSTDATVLSVTIASGLGASSQYTWLKLPVVPNMEKVMASTTLPTLLLGGDPVGDPADTYKLWEDALKLPGVRGLMVGRSLLYPQDGDVAGAIATAVALVHGK
jgi:DhnA family fructose-bisphosphate aldolase class Ia